MYLFGYNIYIFDHITRILRLCPLAINQQEKNKCILKYHIQYIKMEIIQMSMIGKLFFNFMISLIIMY